METSDVSDASKTTEDINEPKLEAILEACKARDAEALISLATSEGGLLQDKLRKDAWPILLGYRQNSESSDFSKPEHPHKHADEEQVKLDVNRAFVYYPNGQTETELDSKKEQLEHLIIRVLKRNPMLCYFQGYHDIAQVLLLVLGGEEAVPAFEHISLFRIRDYMLPSLSPALKHLQLLPAIIETSDPNLRRHLSETKPFFALAATLTLYAHDIQEYSDIARLYDFLLSHEPVVSIYLFAAIILSRKKELFEIPIEEPEMIHFTLSKLPQPLDLEGLIAKAMDLYRDHPPETLPFRAWKKIPRHSVLKTSRQVGLQGTRTEAVELFESQTRQLRREEARQKAIAFIWKYRRPASSIGLAVFVAVLSYWIMRNNIDVLSVCHGYLGRLRVAFRSRIGWLAPFI